MKSSTRLPLAVATAVAGLAVTSVVTAPLASADTRTCRGTINAVSIDGDIVVPSGASCTLRGTMVDGNVLVRRDATLEARGVRVGGSVQADGHRFVLVAPLVNGDQSIRSRINGDVQLEQGSRGTVRNSVIGGNLQVEQNDAKQVATRNRIGADLQAFSNDGGFQISGNAIDGNLQCKSNNPAPTGGNNRVEGNKEDQCKGL